MSITRHHNDWLTLVPNSGPFLSLPVLTQVFPQGLHAHDVDHGRRLREAYGEWDENQTGPRPAPPIHRAWVKFVLGETLDFKELLAEGQAIPQTLKSEIAEYGEPIRPDWVVIDPTTKNARLLVQTYPRSQSLTKPLQKSRSNLSPDTRMMQLLRDTGVRLGIVTNGEHWMLVNAPKKETTGYISWYAHLWLEMQPTLRAFRTLLCSERFFDVQATDTIESLLDRSADDQQDVTDQLGYQVLKAVEVLIQALDKADQDNGRKLLVDVRETVLYEAALTVMMRLVFLFCAEERELLLLGDDLYDKNYAVSTLREQLRATADQFGEEILGLRYDAWTRLLTTFRAVYGGARHDRLKVPAYGGSLFDPDRFAFLEGRTAGTCWKETAATPLPVNNRTVLHLLEALQMLKVRLPGGGTSEARKLSFSELGIEQIGHVYEGLLDHTAKRATEPVLGLQGTRDKEPEIALAELERLKSKGEKELLDFLKDETGRSTISPIKKALTAEIDDQLASRFRTACQDSQLWERVKPFAGVVRLDTTDYPVVITPNSVFVTAGPDRRSSGTHYTPKSLTEPIVEHTLDPLVYFGPAEGLPRSEWRLKTPTEILALKICDMACGSGAFLVQACRYLAGKLQESWKEIERVVGRGEVKLFEPPHFASSEVEEKQPEPRTSPFGFVSEGKPQEQLLPGSDQDRETLALRLIAQRCLYGVDINHLAVEMAKLSLWLLTLAKDMPFEFLDHAIRCGDSLVGITHLDQLRHFSLDLEGPKSVRHKGVIMDEVGAAIEARLRIERMPVNSVEDVHRQEELLKQSEQRLKPLRCAADLLASASFWKDSPTDREEWSRHFSVAANQLFDTKSFDELEQLAAKERRSQMVFHWPLEFPEVFADRGGFDGIIGNPPFITGTSISTILGTTYRKYLKTIWPHFQSRADLCVGFLLRGSMILRDSGTAGFVGTDTVSEGDSRLTGPAHLLSSGFAIYRAIKREKWPGRAVVRICHCHFTRGAWNGTYILDGIPVAGIDSAFDSAVQGVEPETLQEACSMSFTGTKVYGNGFVLSLEEGQQFLDTDVRYSKVIKPYFVGRELNEVSCKPGRFIIDFTGMERKEAEAYPLAWNIVNERVREERQTAPEKKMREVFWQFQRPRKELYSLLRKRGNAWVIAATSDTVAFIAIEYAEKNPVVFSHAVNVLALQGYGHFAVVQSTLHLSWARRYGSSMKGDMRYTTTDCFETFPFPSDCSSLEEIGREYYRHRFVCAEQRSIGLTDLYQLMHLSTDESKDVIRLRTLHAELDRSVADAYGLRGVELNHGFHDTQHGIRYTISEAARRKVLDFLLKLNLERHAKEVSTTREANDKPETTHPKAKSKPNRGSSPDLFAGEEDA